MNVVVFKYRIIRAVLAMFAWVGIATTCLQTFHFRKLAYRHFWLTNNRSTMVSGLELWLRLGLHLGLGYPSRPIVS